MATVTERVDAGIAFLDEDQPDWRTKIDLSTFSIRLVQYCVLGQVYGGYWNAPVLRDIHWADDDSSVDNAVQWSYDRGFTAQAYGQVSVNDEWDQLETEWRSRLS